MATSKTRMVLKISLLVLLTILDARDLGFKTRWLGVSDSFAYSTSETTQLSPEKLIATDNVEARTSGWSSILQTCESVQAFRGTSSLLHTNCDIGGGGSKSPIDLIATANVRADSMAWAACSLLYSYRRPPICRAAKRS
ncbi:hypothetical protein Gpo141_00005154 [Globisporangium polare]